MKNKYKTILPVPPFFNPEKTAQVWPVPYQQRADQATAWAEQYSILPSAGDPFKIALIAVDVQNSFCTPGFELFVAGRSGTGAVDDTRRLCQFIYRNLSHISHIAATLDTHTAMQIFHPIFLVDPEEEHPSPLTSISYDDVLNGRWRFNPQIAPSLGISPEYGQQHLLHYAGNLKQHSKYDLTIWPYHVMTGSIGNALVSSFEEAVFFHTIARQNQVEFIVKGENPLTENYSAISPEVLEGPGGEKIDRENPRFLQIVQQFDAVIIVGQAKSHCIDWTVSDLLDNIQVNDPLLAQKVYLLEDCCSPVVVPGVVDYTDAADKAFDRFENNGMHLVRSDQPLSSWPGIPGGS